MRLETLLLVLAAAGILYFAVQHNRSQEKIRQLKIEMEAQKQKKAEEAASPPKPAGSTIKCFQCDGLGKLIDDSGVKQMAYVCPICGGVGKRTLPPGTARCTYCKGMGRIQMQSRLKGGTKTMESRRVIAQFCPICGGTGIDHKLQEK
jgi:Zn finger protein HypA/HybF involved in hydrogenase expression